MVPACLPINVHVIKIITDRDASPTIVVCTLTIALLCVTPKELVIHQIIVFAMRVTMVPIVKIITVLLSLIHPIWFVPETVHV